jgi:hypothetical protein
MTVAIESWGSTQGIEQGLSDSYITTPGGTGVRPSADQTAAIEHSATSGGVPVNNGPAPQVSY